MSTKREELQEALCRYTKDTITYMNTVTEFCVNISTWTSRMEADLSSMKNIKDKVAAGNEKEELQKELADVLKATLGGLEELDCFLEAVEKLAVTSLHVFTEEKLQVLGLPQGFGPENIQVVIVAARLICPLLLDFKRNADAFFLPKLQNLEVLLHQLDKYIQTTQKICEVFQRSGVQNLFRRMSKEMVVVFREGLSEDEIQTMLCRIKQLDTIRMDEDFRMVFLFQGKSGSSFIKEFSERKPNMQNFITDLKKHAVQLDNINMRAKISSVAGSSAGAISGVLSIAGLALMPFTAGLSLNLLVVAGGLGVTSAATSFVTAATEIDMVKKEKKTYEVFQRFMDDVQSLQDCLEAIKQDINNMNQFVRGSSILCKGIDAFADLVCTARALAKGTLILSKTARAGLIGVNALFAGMDMYIIYKDGKILAKGSETEISQFIRARTALWSSEMDSWQKIHDSLCKGQELERDKAILETPLHLDI